MGGGDSAAAEARLTTFGVDSSEAVIAHLVHEAVEEGGGPLSVHPELPLGGVVVHLVDVFAPVRAAANAHHPQELVDVCNTTLTSAILIQTPHSRLQF